MIIALVLIGAILIIPAMMSGTIHVGLPDSVELNPEVKLLASNAVPLAIVSLVFIIVVLLYSYFKSKSI